MNNLPNIDRWFIADGADGKYIYGEIYFNGKYCGKCAEKILRIEFVDRTVSTPKYTFELGDEHK